jgi:hypothetical protein
MSVPFDAAAAEMLLGWGGQAGADFYQDTSSHDGDWCKIVAVEGAVVIASLTSNWNANPVNLAEGQAIYGKFTQIQLTLGKVHCYHTVTK